MAVVGPVALIVSSSRFFSLIKNVWGFLLLIHFTASAKQTLERRATVKGSAEMRLIVVVTRCSEAESELHTFWDYWGQTIVVTRIKAVAPLSSDILEEQR